MMDDNITLDTDSYDFSFLENPTLLDLEIKETLNGHGLTNTPVITPNDIWSNFEPQEHSIHNEQQNQITSFSNNKTYDLHLQEHTIENNAHTEIYEAKKCIIVCRNPKAGNSYVWNYLKTAKIKKEMAAKLLTLDPQALEKLKNNDMYVCTECLLQPQISLSNCIIRLKNGAPTNATKHLAKTHGIDPIIMKRQCKTKQSNLFSKRVNKKTKTTKIDTADLSFDSDNTTSFNDTIFETTLERYHHAVIKFLKNANIPLETVTNNATFDELIIFVCNHGQYLRKLSPDTRQLKPNQQ